MKKLALTLLTILTCLLLQAQDTLPRFAVKNVGNNRIVIDWYNAFPDVKQISIQRSTDSLKNFKTLLTVPDPTVPQNGYADTKAPDNNMFYRLYIQRDKGVFLFSASMRPVWDTVVKREMLSTEKLNLNLPVIPNGNGGSTPAISNTVAVKPDLWTASKFVYTFKDGYIRISLPEDEKKYSIKFFTEEGKPLFELKDIKDRTFKIDKANFYHSGWFKFELYEDGELKEKNKFFLPREF